MQLATENHRKNFCCQPRQQQQQVSLLLLHRFVSLALLLSTCFFSFSLVVSASAIASPISHFSESLAASSAHGTIIAIVCSNQDNTVANTKSDDRSNESCVVVVSHSPFNEEDEEEEFNVEPTAAASSGDDSDQHQERILHYGSITSKLHYLHSDLLLGMTGFVPDLNHLLRSFANMALQFEGVVSSSTNSVEQQLLTRTIPIKKLVVQGISREMRNAVMGINGRPFGVQVLIVGRKPTLGIYTVDTTGGWTHWGGGAAAIGRHDQNVRIHLAKMLKNKEHSSIEDAVTIAMKSMLQASLPFSRHGTIAAAATAAGIDNDSGDGDELLASSSGHNFNAVVVFGSQQKTTVRLTSTYLKHICNSVIEELKDKAIT